MILPAVFCVTGIDTDIGKTIATGLLAYSFRRNGIKTITQKIVQTGCVGLSEDILRHRQLMEIEVLPVDRRGLTCPYVFPVPCSPHLAARLAKREIDCEVIRRSTAALLTEFDVVLLEGAGGLMVPLNGQYTLLDYLEDEHYPLILVTSSRLGSINHTLSALELASRRKLEVAAIVYNRLGETDERIVADSREVFGNSMKKYGYCGQVIDLLPLAVYERAGNKPDLFNYFNKAE
jgi:dethiobiotin synthetase